MVQRVQFILGGAVLTPPIENASEFLAGERITLAGQAFIVGMRADGGAPGKTRAGSTAVRRVQVVPPSEWDAPVIDRGYSWPPEPLA